MSRIKNIAKKILLPIVLLFAVNYISSFFVVRVDLTKDQRYTLSKPTKELLKKVDRPIFIDVLLGGNPPAEFKRLQTETKQLLEEFSNVNDYIIFNIVDPLESGGTKEQIAQSLMELGLTPASVTIEEGNSVSREMIFPWAMVNSGSKTVKASLLNNSLGANSEARINNSVQQLEHTLADAIYQVTITDKKSIAVIKGQGEMDDKYMADFLRNLQGYYHLAEFNMDSLHQQPQATLENLKRFQAAIIAKPTQGFSENEKMILDQYIISGGKTLWLLDQVAADLDSLQNDNFRSLAFPMDLNLDDMLFKYGVRINKDLVQDLISTPVTVTDANGEIPLNWFYSPMVASLNNHPINNSLNVVKLEFANSIDTLSNGIDKTILLQSSNQSRAVGVPRNYSLDEFDNPPNLSEFSGEPKMLGVLLEGQFNSAYSNRVKPFIPDAMVEKNQYPNKMIIISDGDIINYTYANKKPLVGGIDPWTKQLYSNRNFLLNCVNYLVQDNGLINIRSKEIYISLLDKQKSYEQKTWWQLVNIGVPIVTLLLFGSIFYYVRRKKYGH
ncbi:gliding motility-associated ABC transporter substrate-binding protein GldG [Galbibacter sp.]|uniref:gliding motility-associated ABC transporter substrate-binding protein GldG n=1 Tax=Galbibacter sp. TaxID=2918471 RepID=UPI002BC261B0|nr:gliding motility-associated ABC transporter substrate-binding protein GldG [Galbibacter sp.]HLV62077.1 gliding motility-associated ABC transporter substrate-binding protein GldG [Galbibacter sp.]